MVAINKHSRHQTVRLPTLDSIKLPSLLTDLVLIGHNRKADLVFTPAQWFELCVMMRNNNPQNFFLMPYRDKAGCPKYAKAQRARADDRIRWAYDYITGHARAPASVGFYPWNEQRQSRWAAIDVDVHDGGDALRARQLALDAFKVLYQQPQLYVVLCTSGSSGWHIFVFSAEFHECDEWTRLLKQVAALIGAPIRKGEFEIFPDSSHGIGNGIRAPGAWNPRTGQFDLIEHENITKLLGSGKERSAFLSASGTTEQKNLSSPSRKKSDLFRGRFGQWKEKFAITAPRSRHDQLSRLVGEAFHQCSRFVASENARLQHEEASPAPTTPIKEHMEEFSALWEGLHHNWMAGLSDRERRLFDALTTDAERCAFRVLRSWSEYGAADGDFKIQVEGLASRLGLSIRGAGKLRTRFCHDGILTQTAEFVPHRLAARFEWSCEHRAHFTSSSQDR